MKKSCTKCHETKPLSEFYRYAKPPAGRHTPKCKECLRAESLKYRADNLDRARELDRERGQLPHRKEGNRARYKQRTSTPEGRAAEWARRREWTKQSRLGRAAHVLTGNAIRGGRLVKGPCERCGTKERIHAHHEDYEKPLEVTWLCRDCHGKRHRELNKLKRAQSVP